MSTAILIPYVRARAVDLDRLVNPAEDRLLTAVHHAPLADGQGVVRELARGTGQIRTRGREERA